MENGGGGRDTGGRNSGLQNSQNGKVILAAVVPPAHAAKLANLGAAFGECCLLFMSHYCICCVLCALWLLWWTDSLEHDRN